MTGNLETTCSCFICPNVARSGSLNEKARQFGTFFERGENLNESVPSTIPIEQASHEIPSTGDGEEQKTDENATMQNQRDFGTPLFSTAIDHDKDDEVMSQTSAASLVSTIFDGVRNDGMDVIRAAQKQLSATIKKFKKAHDNAKETKDADDEECADDERRRAVKMAWLLIEEMHRMFPSDSNMDVYAKECVKRYVAKHKGEMDDRPLLTEEIRTDARFNDPFPTADDVTKPPGKGQKRADNVSLGQPPLEKRDFVSQCPNLLSVPEIAASPNPAGTITNNDYDSPVPPPYDFIPVGAIPKKRHMTQEWVKKAIRERSPSQALMRMEEEEMDRQMK